MGEEDGVIDVAPDWALHRKTFSAILFFFLGGFLILFLLYFSFALVILMSHPLPTMDSAAN